MNGAFESRTPRGQRRPSGPGLPRLQSALEGGRHSMVPVLETGGSRGKSIRIRQLMVKNNMIGGWGEKPHLPVPGEKSVVCLLLERTESRQLLLPLLSPSQIKAPPSLWMGQLPLLLVPRSFPLCLPCGLVAPPCCSLPSSSRSAQTTRFL